MLPRFEVVRRLRPVDLVAPGSVLVDTSSPAGSDDTSDTIVAMPAPAPYVAATTEVRDRTTSLALHVAGLRIGADVRDGSVSLTVAGGDTTRELRSRRFHRAEDPGELGLSLTGTHVTAWTREAGSWMARARHDLREACDTRDEAALAALRVELPAWGGVAGGFGRLAERRMREVGRLRGIHL